MKYVYYAHDYNSDYIQHFEFPFKIDLSGARKAFNNTVSSVRKGLGGLSKNVSKAVSDASKNVGDAVSKATKTASKSIGAIDREWKNHKWIDRKRDKNGKWIYDYGFGFPGEKKKDAIGEVLDYDDDVIKQLLHLNSPHSMFDDQSIYRNMDNVLTKPSLGDLVFNKVVNSLVGNENPISMAADSILTNKRIADAHYRKLNEPVDKNTGFHLKTKNTSKDEDLKATNPSYKNIDGTGTTNCYACTLAYDLRRRGYDVNAVEDGDGAQIGTIKKFYKNPKITYVGEGTRPAHWRNPSYNITNELESELLKEPKGSRGYLSLNWTSGSGHAVAYEREKDGVYIYDAQSGEKLNLSDYGDLASSAVYFRTDNLDVNVDEAKKVVY